MNRRRFLAALAAGLTLPAVLSARRPASPRKNWAWLRGDTTDVDAWKRMLAGLKTAGFDAVLIAGDAAFYRTHVPIARDAGLELHAWMFTMMRGENVTAHPDWYAVSRSGVSTAVKPPYVDY